MDIRDHSVVRPPAAPLDPANLPVRSHVLAQHVHDGLDEGQGWYDARIVPYGPIHLPPAAAVFHYGQEIFEGLKAFQHADGSIHIFRPDRNANRLNASARRMSMPEVPVDLQLEAMRRWSPSTAPGCRRRPARSTSDRP